MSCGHVFKQEAEKRARESEKKKIILKGSGFLYPPPPQVLLPHTRSIPPVALFSP